MPGFPCKLSTAGTVGAEIVTSPAIAELDGDPKPEIVTATNEVTDANPSAPDEAFALLNVFLSSATGSNPVYAVNHDGTPVPGWPVEVGVAAGDLLPFVLPGHDAAVVNVNGGTDEVSVSAATSLAGQGSRLVNGSGGTVSTYANSPANTVDNGPILNLADYSSIGDVTGLGDPWVVKGGLTINGVANLLAVNQNLPFSHVEQAWDISTGAPTAPAAPGYPRATDDFQLVSQASIARVSGSGPGRQVLVGTGLYQLHAYDSLGQEASGWPKFTGGWNETTPAVGDADGDGDLEVTGYTREGWSFLRDTGVDACADSNNEWWTLHHDERGTSNYATDSRPPGTPEGLTAQRNGSTVTLNWTAPGDDWMCGTAQKLRVLASTQPIQHPNQGAQIREDNVTVGAGQGATLQLTDAELGQATHVAIFYRDEAGNWGRLADVAVPPAGGGGEPTPTPEPNPPAAGPCSNVIPASAGPDKLNGTDGSDKINGQGGADKIKGGAGDDCLRGGRGRDRISGGEGDDKIHVRGGRRDRVNCGPGDDTVVASAADRVNQNCEKVQD